MSKKLSKIEVVNGRAHITTETPRLFRSPKMRSFVATKQICEGYWEWLELPNKTLVHDALSFQLDAWMRESLIGNYDSRIK